MQLKQLIQPPNFIKLLLLVSFVLLAGCAQNKDNNKINEVCFLQKCFAVEVAITPEERTRGLMHRKHLGQKEGMLFIFPAEAEYGFWMKNTLIPVDIIWLNKNKEVVFINKNTPPCDGELCEIIKPTNKASYVLEINAGLADNIDLQIGDKISFK